MARYLNLTNVLLLQAILTLSSSAHPANGLSLSLEDRVQQLTEKFINNKIKDIIVLAKDARLEELESKVTQLELKVEELKTENQQQQEMIVVLQQHIDQQQVNSDHPKSSVPISADKFHTGLAVAAIPKSCADLSYVGHSLNGLYLIMGTEHVETVFCDFSVPLPSDPNFQTWIGQVDVKSSPVYFYVQKSIDFSTIDTPIPFELERLNIGNAMNLTSGKFTAPRTGTYHFSFTEMTQFSGDPDSGLGIALILNGSLIASTLADEITSSSTPEHDTTSLHSTLYLQAGNQVWLQIYAISPGTFLFDSFFHLTQFSGWLLDENISQSLNAL